MDSAIGDNTKLPPKPLGLLGRDEMNLAEFPISPGPGSVATRRLCHRGIRDKLARGGRREVASFPLIWSESSCFSS
jgi:hypothetical protein